jgi:hypothetical protein
MSAKITLDQLRNGGKERLAIHPNGNPKRNRFGHWDLTFGIYLRFVIWSFGF